MAKDFGFNGIEVRGLGQEIFSVKVSLFPKIISRHGRKAEGTAS
jgi:hypothetical protein